jgi:hypothetical protein
MLHLFLLPVAAGVDVNALYLTARDTTCLLTIDIDIDVALIAIEIGVEIKVTMALLTFGLLNITLAIVSVSFMYGSPSYLISNLQVTDIEERNLQG